MANDISEQINKILTRYMNTAEDTIREVTESVANDTAKQLKRTSPRSTNRGKHYASGWKVKTGKLVGQRLVESVVYQATKPQLTHLLARSHDIKNQYGEWGRSVPDPHIDDAERDGIELFLKELERKL